MYNIKVKDILEATGGKLLAGDENVEIKDVCIDSREVKEGDLFVPIVGERIDAHRFIESAMETCAATLTQRHSVVVISDKPYIQVTDTLKALQDIGAYIRNRLDIPIVGVTGSVGKTTTREMISTALAGCVDVYQTMGNYNSQVGVPVTIARATKSAQVAVLEMGMSEVGEMSNLSRIVRPDICVITVIGVAHIEHLKTQENIRREKLAITEYMNKNGVLFLNGDDPLLMELKGKTDIKTCYYGLSGQCEYRAENVHMENYKIKYDYVHGNVRVPVILNALGKHNVSNSLVGMAIADYMGLSLTDAAKGFESFSGIRQKLISIPGKYTIIDDTYNASPDSMKASINVLADMDNHGKKIAVLGDMFELGENSEKYHYDVGLFLADKPIDELVVVGEMSQSIKQAVEDAGSPIKCYSFKDNGEVALYLMTVMMPDDVVLIKGSNGMKLNEIVSNMRG
ncbi:MAG: UDP-N-acetylmuramoyl-tripeptide--D-alanyl-D-alanine ligase [Clostridium sp.]|nr:UDP-N-acetylmuramoyl-tripeptide--D-alanyl-D-alanine ligase [Clostridium sp.]MCM1398380.1 UDP-N-acetylmuramoyl-tripeptide--D-alanyl-D-alanine ligase [Clostridium sp.]MCM1458955.1 UDP-N-acetylmuramoyl-tripeptide--D-alanyl-D-alanine ligase [Bacteroides sp.]